MPLLLQRMFCALIAASVLVASAIAAEPAFQSPLSPEESLKYFELADPDLKIELAACEPEVVDPVAIRFDEDGRMWVVEMRDYPNGPAEGEPPLSHIVVLEDRDDDGRFEMSTLFADKLLFATGLQPWKGGVFVTLAGRVAYMKDTDGDGKADVDETWFTGFVEENPQLRANHPTLAMDGWIYVANGLRGGTIVDARHPDKPAVSISNRDFRFHPITGECEAVSGAGQFGMTFDDDGNRFICDNRHPLRHVVLEERYLQRNPAVAIPSVVQEVAAFDAQSRVFPISQAWTTSNLHAGQFTAACGIEIYRGDALPKEKYYGAGFICEPTGNLVHAEMLERDGASFTSKAIFDGKEFLASPDEWFRPVNLEVGPDGALYVVDMYRAVIEHPQWVPDELKHRPDERYGDDRGRIYRIAPKDATTWRSRSGRPSVSKQPLLMQLSENNGWLRDTAARLLLERFSYRQLHDLPVLGAARHRSYSISANFQSMKARGVLTLDELFARSTTGKNEQWVAAAERWLVTSSKLQRQVLKLANCPSPRDRFQVALSLGFLSEEKDQSEVISALAKIAIASPEDIWTRRAVALSAGPHASKLLAGVLAKLRASNRQAGANEQALVAELAGLCGTQSDANEALQTLSLLIGDGESGAREQRAALIELLKALSRRGISLKAATGDVDVEKLTDIMRRVWKDAASDALDRIEEDSPRRQAIGLLAFAPFDSAGDALMKLVRDDPSQDIRLAAIEALAAHGDERIGPLLLEDFSGRTPAVRRAVLDAVIDAGPRATLLLDEIEQERIAPTELDRARADRLLAHRDERIKARANKLLAEIIPADRKQVLEQYQPALQLAADAKRGQELFRKTCSTCHKIGEIGVNVAPDISDSRVKTPAQLLLDILQPNKAIDNNYISYAVVTKDGQSLLGVIVSESGSSVTLKLPENKLITLLRTDIDEIRSTGKSLMPDGLEKNLPLQDMADVISFVKNWRYMDGKVPAGK